MVESPSPNPVSDAAQPLNPPECSRDHLVEIAVFTNWLLFLIIDIQLKVGVNQDLTV